MATGGGETRSLLAMACARFEVTVEQFLGGRASLNWLVRRGTAALVLRSHRPTPWQSLDQLEAAIRWRSAARSAVRGLGWPVARSVGEPWFQGGSWWTVEEFLPGSVVSLTAARHAELLAKFHRLDVTSVGLGPQPGRLNHLAVLHDDSAEEILWSCQDAADRSWLLRRLEQARTHAAEVEWEASRKVLVHGDFTAQNLLFSGSKLTGVVDFELASVDRRVLDLLLVWRCRHDTVLLAYDALAPLTAEEWRMLLVDWWALLVSLSTLAEDWTSSALPEVDHLTRDWLGDQRAGVGGDSSSSLRGGVVRAGDRGPCRGGSRDGAAGSGG